MSEAQRAEVPGVGRRPVTVLLVEDNPGDALLIRFMLAKAGEGQVSLERVERLGDALGRLEKGGIDVVLLDLSLPDSQGLETFARVHGRVPQMPILVMTGHDDSGVAVQAVNRGAQDYLVKGQVDAPVLMRSILHALERKRITEALRENEQRYKLLVESTSDYIYTVTVANGISLSTLHGAGCTRITGYAPGDYERDRTLWFRMIHEADRGAVLEDAARAVKGLPTMPLEHRLQHRDGSMRWVKHTSVSRRNERGEVVAVDGIITDITERRAAEERVRSSEALYQSLVECLPQHIFRKDREGRFTFANSRFCNELGQPLAKVLGKSDADFFPAALAAEYRADDERVMQGGQIMEKVEEHVRPDGEKQYVQVVKIPLVDVGGRVTGLQGIFWDITRQKRSEAELRESADALRAANTELRNAQMQLIQAEKMLSVAGLAAGVAHEVKNPLAVLSMGVEFLRRQPFAAAEEFKEVLADMTDAVERANGVIGGLLDYSRERELVLRRESLREVIRRSLGMLRHEFTARAVEVVEELPESLPLVEIDRVKIEQVLVNLFTNAVHAMPRFGTLTVRAYGKVLGADEAEINPGLRGWNRIRVGDRVVVVEIDDTGSGIPEDKLSRVFDPFFTTKPTGQGSGLGLSVVARILELHGGMISLRNRPEGGARAKLFFRAVVD